MNYRIMVWREWKEFGHVNVEADSEDDALEEARELLSSDEDIEWDSENMEPGNQDVEGVEE